MIINDAIIARFEAALKDGRYASKQPLPNIREARVAFQEAVAKGVYESDRAYPDYLAQIYGADVTRRYIYAKSQKEYLLVAIEGMLRADRIPSGMSQRLRTHFRDFPDLNIQWAKKLMGWGYTEEAKEFTLLALASAHHDKRPCILFSQAITNLRALGLYEDAHKLTQFGVRAWPEEGFFQVIQANDLMRAGQIEDALKILEGNFKKFSHDKIFIRTLANAYALAGAEEKFIKIKSSVEGDMQAYLEAKLYFMINQPQKALTILTPLIQKATIGINSSVSLFLACIPDQHPFCAFLQKTIDANRFANLLQWREVWRTDPRRADDFDPGFSNTVMMYELGANPASSSDRQKAGMNAWDAKVAVKRTVPSHRLPG